MGCLSSEHLPEPLQGIKNPDNCKVIQKEATKERIILGIDPGTAVMGYGLVKEMVAADLDIFKREKLLHESGYKIKNQFE